MITTFRVSRPTVSRPGIITISVIVPQDRGVVDPPPEVIINAIQYQDEAERLAFLPLFQFAKRMVY